MIDIFPPPGPDNRDSFFAQTLTAKQSNARLYVGIAAQYDKAGLRLRYLVSDAKKLKEKYLDRLTPQFSVRLKCVHRE